MTVSTATGLLVDFMPGAGPYDLPDDFYLLSTGATGSNATTPDDPALDIVGDIDVRVDMTLDGWAPPSGGGYEVFGKFTPAGNQSWLLWLDSNRKIVLYTSVDGTAVITSRSTTPIPITSGRLAIRATCDVNNGAGGNTVTFYTAPTISGTWTQLGTPLVNAGTTSIFNSNASVGIGNVPNSGFASPPGRFHAARIYADLVGTDVRANPDFTAQTPGTTSFADGAGRTWTVNSPASVAGFSWVDITERATKGRVSWTVGRSDELAAFSPGTAELVLDNDDRLFDPTHTAGTYYGKLNPRTPFRIRSTSSALDLPGSAGATASTPDHSSFAITDLDVRIRCSMTDWTPGGFGKFLVGQYPNVAGNNGWFFGINATGFPTLSWTANGTTAMTRTSTSATGFTDGSDHWLRVVLDVVNGADHTVLFYTSTDGLTWDLLSFVTTAGNTSIFNSTAPLAVSDVLPFAGKVRYVELRSDASGSSSVIANPEFFAQRPGTTSFTDRTGKIWTVNGAASIANDTATATDQFYGFATGGFRQLSSPPEKGDCAVDLVDMLGVLNGADLPASAYEAEVLADNPLAHWRLDETAGTQMADSSGNGRHGYLDNGLLGQDPLITGTGHSINMAHVGDNRGRWSGEGLPQQPPVSLEAWIKTPRDAAAIKSIIVVQRDSSLGGALWLQLQTSAGGSPNGEVVINFFGLGSSYKARGHVRVDDDERHHIVCTIAGLTPSDVLLFVDGVAQTKTTISGTNPGTWFSCLQWTVGNTLDTTSGDWGLDGDIDEVAVYDYVLEASRIADHYEAGADAFDNEATGDRIDRVLDLVGVPSSMRDIATGDTFAGPADYGGQSAGAYIQAVVESEQGVFFVDHRNGGKVKFRGRFARLTESRSTTSRWTFTDTDAAGNLHYESEGFDVDPNSQAGIVNVVRVGWRGGIETVVDTASRDAYGPQERRLETAAPTPETARSAGNWLINRYGQPQERIRGFRLRPDADKRLWPAALDLQVSDRITLDRHPQQVGSSSSTPLTVEGITHTVQGTHWTTAVRTSSAVLGDVWIWGTSRWGETTVWG